MHFTDETLLIKNIKPYAKNAKKHPPEQVANIAESIREFGWSQPIVVDENGAIRCGDNGIFRGSPVTPEQAELTKAAKFLYDKYMSDGKYIIDGATKMIICQSNAKEKSLKHDAEHFAVDFVKINPLGEWTGGTEVDTGATNRKLGSDMGDGVTGGGLHGKDLSKADVSLNIYAHLKAQRTGKPVELYCAIGDEYIDGYRYEQIVEIAREYIESIGGFERFAEWGLIRP